MTSTLEYQCRYCPTRAWHLGGSDVLGRHLETVHGLDGGPFPAVAHVDMAGRPVDWEGVPTTPPRHPVDGLLRAVPCHRLTIPAPAKWLSANGSYGRWERARHVKTWREATLVHARAARLPRGLAKVRVDAVLTFATRRHRDEHNYMPTLKAIVDGLGPDKSRVTKTGKHISAPGYGLIADDTPEHLEGPYIRFATETGSPVVALTIREV